MKKYFCLFCISHCSALFDNYSPRNERIKAVREWFTSCWKCSNFRSKRESFIFCFLYALLLPTPLQLIGGNWFMPVAEQAGFSIWFRKYAPKVWSTVAFLLIFPISIIGIWCWKRAMVISRLFELNSPAGSSLPMFKDRCVWTNLLSSV